MGSPRNLLPSTGIDKSAHERINGLSDGHLEFNSWFNDATDQEHDALSGLPTADVLLFYALGLTRGDPAALLTAKQINYDWARGEDGSLQGTIAAEANAVPLEWGVMLTAGKITDSSATNSPSLDNTASSASGLAAQLQLMSLGSGTVNVTIEDSANDSDWANILSFTAATARTSERKTLAGTIRQYLRIATTGTFTNAVFAVAVRRGTADDDVAY